MRKPLLLLFISAASACFAQVTFSSLDLSARDRLLFTASALYPDYGTFNTLFLADARTRGMRQLTFFPEDILLLQDKEVLQIQNRFGVFRSDPGFTNIAPLAMFPSFVGGSQIQSGRIAPMQTSPDGRYLLYTRATSAAYGDLTLLDVSSGTQTIVSTRVELSLEELPALWSPDSRFIVYSKAASLYYYSLSQMRDGHVLAEPLRRIGDGTTANIAWTRERSLFYISGLIVYSIDPSELFTRALYAGFLKIGKVAGKIPFDFDSNFDSFWVSPDGRNLLLDKGGRNLFLYYLATDDFHANGTPLNLPYLYLPRDTTVRKVIWSTGEHRHDALRNALRRGPRHDRVPPLHGRPGTRTAALSRPLTPGCWTSASHRTRAWPPSCEADGVSWRDYATWQEKGRLAHPSPLHVLWLSQDELLLAGAFFIERLSLATGASTLVALSQPGQYGFSGDSDQVETSLQGRALALNEPNGTWSPAASFQVRTPPGAASPDLRVYLEDSTRGSYSNLVMVRDGEGFRDDAAFPAGNLRVRAFPRKG